jgi:hypothetical protein
VPKSFTQTCLCAQDRATLTPHHHSSHHLKLSHSNFTYQPIPTCCCAVPRTGAVLNRLNADTKLILGTPLKRDTGLAFRGFSSSHHSSPNILLPNIIIRDDAYSRSAPRNQPPQTTNLLQYATANMPCILYTWFGLHNTPTDEHCANITSPHCYLHPSHSPASDLSMEGNGDYRSSLGLPSSLPSS